MARVTYTNGVLKAYTIALPAKADRLAAKAGARGEGLVKERIVAVGAVDTGAMLNSVNVQNAGPGQREIVVGVAYGPHVNYGTYKMAARPFWEPAIEQLKTELPAMAKAELSL